MSFTYWIHESNAFSNKQEKGKKKSIKIKPIKSTPHAWTWYKCTKPKEQSCDDYSK